MAKRSLSIEQILTMLTEAPVRIATWTASLAPEQLHAAPAPDAWSAHAVLAHLRSCADVWGSCIAMIITEDRPTIRAINPRTWIKGTDYLDQEFHASLHAFAAQRVMLLAMLKLADPANWERSATVTGAGKPLERTVHGYAQWLATHERPHIKQIERAVKALRS